MRFAFSLSGSGASTRCGREDKKEPNGGISWEVMADFFVKNVSAGNGLPCKSKDLRERAN